MSKNALDKDVLVKLYTIYQHETIEWLKLHEQHFTRFVTIIIGFLSVTLGLFYHFNENDLDAKAIASLPFFNFIFSYVAIRICNRFYKRFLESITIANKIYFLLKNNICDIDETLKNEYKKTGEIDTPYPQDDYLYPIRWIKAMNQFQDSEKFIESRKWTGVNLWRNIVFIALAIVNLLIALIIIAS